MNHARVKNSNWILLLLFCFSLQALIPAGFMLGGSQDSWVTLCTADGLSVQWLNLDHGDSDSSEHSVEHSLCPQSSADLALVFSPVSLEQSFTKKNFPTPPALFRARDISQAYASRAPPATV